MVDTPVIRRIEWTRLSARRPRAAGSNARLGAHGAEVRVGVARVTDSDGMQGFGWSIVDSGAARELVGRPLAEAFTARRGVEPGFRPIEYPLWDLVGRREGRPVFGLVGGKAPMHVPCYDTSLYFDDLDLASDAAAAERMAAEVEEGWARGQRAFKVKVGRGARHMPPEEGLRRDVAVIRAVRQAAGPDAPVLADANNGFNLNLAKRFLATTAEARLHWLEEPFHEDPVLLEDLRGWLRAEGLATLIADGEGLAAPALMDWARRGLIDVVQYDVLVPGFSRWLEIGGEADAAGVRSAPHHYGGFFGNYAGGHLAAAVRGFAFVEWDEASAPWCDTSAYLLRDGRVELPDLPGFGLTLDEAAFRSAVGDRGFVAEAP